MCVIAVVWAVAEVSRRCVVLYHQTQPRRAQPLVELAGLESQISVNLSLSQPASCFPAGHESTLHMESVQPEGAAQQESEDQLLVPFLVFNYPRDFGQEPNSLGILGFFNL